MNPGPLTASPLLLPAPAPTPPLSAGVQPRATSSANHISGAVVGTLATYADLNAFTWFTGLTGWNTRNGRRLAGRGLNGAEDSTCTKRD
jgi:hypothetical protein